MGQRVSISSKVKPSGVAAAQASLNRATKLDVLDPKPGDLTMSRLKLG